jgi:predicted unusual protein kinase regulating ubiquinone biosynthesis (AarF/ABC1/UbiB family)
VSIEKNKARYDVAAHAMQTGVAYEMNKGLRDPATEPKHLRVGINAAMADHEGLARLLIRKGVITEEEYVESMADAMERELKRYQDRMPPNVELH